MAYPIVVAYDGASLDILRGLVNTLCGRVAGFKIGLPTLIANGLDGVREVVKSCKTLWIADVKAADVGHVMLETAKLLLTVFDKVIVHGFVGYRGALEALSGLASSVIVVAAMSHPGAAEAYTRVAPLVAEALRRLRPWGLVAPATMPEAVRFFRTLFPELKILSPGVGAQGAEPGQALCAGADYEIVGRAITGSDNPVEAVERIGRAQLEALKRCRRAS